MNETGQAGSGDSVWYKSSAKLIWLNVSLKTVKSIKAQ